MRLSYSSIESYKQCGLKYKFKEIDKVKEPKSKEAVFGTIVHSALKFVHTSALLPPTLEQTLDFFARSWNPDVFDSPDEERAAFTQGVAMLQRYYADNNVAAATPIALESRFQFEVGLADDRHVVSGIIDRIDKTPDGYEIIDYKTGRTLPSQEAVDRNAQLTIYLKAFLERYPAEANNLHKVTVSLYFLKHGVKLSSSRTMDDLAAMERDILDVTGHIAAGAFDPTVSSLCDWCGYQRLCPMWKHKFKDERTDDVAAQGAVDEYVALKKTIAGARLRMAKLQETIVGYMEQQDLGRMFGKDGIVARGTRTSYSYDAARLHDVLAPLDKWDDAVKVDGVALSRLLPTLPADVRDAVLAARTAKTSATLSVRKSPTATTDDDE